MMLKYMPIHITAYYMHVCQNSYPLIYISSVLQEDLPVMYKETTYTHRKQPFNIIVNCLCQNIQVTNQII